MIKTFEPCPAPFTKKPSSLVLDWTGDLIDQGAFSAFFWGGIGHHSKAPGSSVFYEDFVSMIFLKDGINSHQTDTFWDAVGVHNATAENLDQQMRTRSI